MDTIFKKTVELVRNNPADFQKITQSITKKILKNNHPLKKSEVLKRFRKIWPDSKGKKVIVIGWLLSDSAIGTGATSVPTALAEILTERISNADNNLNPANLQEWIRGTIFHQEESKQRLEESKQRLEDAVRAYETENPLKDESAGTAVQQPKPVSDKAGNTKRKKARKKTPRQFLKEARERQAAQELAKDPNLTAKKLGEILECDKSTVVRMKAWQKKNVLNNPLPKGFIKRTKDENYSTVEAINEPE